MANLFNTETGQMEVGIIEEEVDDKIRSGKYEYSADPNEPVFLKAHSGAPMEALAGRASGYIRDGTATHASRLDIENWHDNQAFGDSVLGSVVAPFLGADDYLMGGMVSSAAEAAGWIDKGAMDVVQARNPYLYHGGGISSTIAAVLGSGGGAALTRLGASGVARGVAAEAAKQGILKKGLVGTSNLLGKYTLTGQGAKFGPKVAEWASGLATKTGRKLGPARLVNSELAGRFGAQGAKVIGAASAGVVEGGLWGAGEGISEAMLGEPGEVAEHIASSIGWNVVIGGAAGVAVSAAVPMLVSAKGLGLTAMSKLMDFSATGTEKGIIKAKRHFVKLAMEVHGMPPEVANRYADFLVLEDPDGYIKEDYFDLKSLTESLDKHATNLLKFFDTQLLADDFIQQAEAGGFDVDFLVRELLNEVATTSNASKIMDPVTFLGEISGSFRKYTSALEELAKAHKETNAAGLINDLIIEAQVAEAKLYRAFYSDTIEEGLKTTRAKALAARDAKFAERLERTNAISGWKRIWVKKSKETGPDSLKERIKKAYWARDNEPRGTKKGEPIDPDDDIGYSKEDLDDIGFEDLEKEFRHDNVSLEPDDIDDIVSSLDSDEMQLQRLVGVQNARDIMVKIARETDGLDVVAAKKLAKQIRENDPDIIAAKKLAKEIREKEAAHGVSRASPISSFDEERFNLAMEKAREYGDIQDLIDIIDEVKYYSYLFVGDGKKPPRKDHFETMDFGEYIAKAGRRRVLEKDVGAFDKDRHDADFQKFIFAKSSELKKAVGDFIGKKHADAWKAVQKHIDDADYDIWHLERYGREADGGESLIDGAFLSARERIDKHIEMLERLRSRPHQYMPVGNIPMNALDHPTSQAGYGGVMELGSGQSPSLRDWILADIIELEKTGVISPEHRAKIVAQAWKFFEQAQTRIFNEVNYGNTFGTPESAAALDLLNIKKNLLGETTNQNTWRIIAQHKVRFDKMISDFKKLKEQVVSLLTEGVGHPTVATQKKLEIYLKLLDRDTAMSDSAQLIGYSGRAKELLEMIQEQFDPAPIKVPPIDMEFQQGHPMLMDDVVFLERKSKLEEAMKGPTYIPTEDATPVPVPGKYEFQQRIQQIIEFLDENQVDIDVNLDRIRRDLPVAKWLMGPQASRGNMGSHIGNISRGGIFGAFAAWATGIPAAGVIAGVGAGLLGAAQNPRNMMTLFQQMRAVRKLSKQTIGEYLDEWMRDDLPKSAIHKRWEHQSRQGFLLAASPVMRDPSGTKSKMRKKAAETRSIAAWQSRIEEAMGAPLEADGFFEVRASLEQLAKSPLVMEKFLDQTTRVFELAPGIREEMKSLLERHVHIAKKAIPKTSRSTMFNEEYPPTPMQLQKFANVLQMLTNPVETLLTGMLTGTITTEMVDTLREAWPIVYAEIYTKALEILSEPEKRNGLSQAQKQTLSTLLAIPYASQNELSRLQKNTEVGGQEGDQPGPSPGPKGRGVHSPQSSLNGTMTGIVERASV